MSTTANPKKTFLQTLGKHLVPPGTKLPGVEPTPPAEPAPEPAAAPAAAAPQALEPTPTPEPTPAPNPSAPAAPEPTPEPTPGEPTPTVTPTATQTPTPTVEPTPTPKPQVKIRKSEPLPPIAQEDLSAPEATDPVKPVDELLGYAPAEAERDYLEVLQHAAATDPNYQAVYDREIDRLKKVNQFVTKWRAEHEDEELDPNDPEYRKFLRAHPAAIDGTAHRKLERAMVKDQARAEAEQGVMQRLRPELAKVTEIETKPLIERAEKAVEQAVLAALPQDDRLATVGKEGGLSALAAIPVEGATLVRAAERGKQLVGEYHRLRRGLVQPDTANEVHAMLGNIISNAATVFEQSGGEDRVRTKDGVQQRFVAPAVYSKLTPAARKRHWTFEDQDVQDILVSLTAAEAIKRLEDQRKELAAWDAARAKTPTGEPKPAKPAPKPATPPSPTVTPSPSGAPATGARAGGGLKKYLTGR